MSAVTPAGVPAKNIIKVYPIEALIEAGTYQATIDQIASQVAAKAVQKNIASTPTAITIRPIAPGDLGLTTDAWVFTNITSSGTVQIVSYTVPQNKLYAIYGFFDYSSSPVVNGVILSGPAATYLYAFVQDIYGYRPPAGIFNVTLTYGPTDTVKVSVISSASTASEAFGLLGFVAEPAGTTFTPPP